MSQALPDPSLAQHLARLETYTHRSGLLRSPADRPGLRRALAAFLVQRTPALLDAWLREIGPALSIPEHSWPEIKADQAVAITRWARHIADPSNIETYLFLRRHTRRGFISQFPASRFLTAQMRFAQLVADDLRREYTHDTGRAEELCALLDQELRERVLHITDFFVEGREEELLEQEASYRRAIDHAPACILMAEAELGTIFDANQVAERILGYPRDELLGRLLHEMYPVAERSHAEALWRGAVDQGHASRDDLHLLARDGRVIPVSTNAGYIEYGDRNWVQVIFADLTDRKRLESQLVQSEKMAAIGQLAAGVAHELRNPLAIVMNALYDLRQLVSTDNPEIAEDLRIAEEEIARAQAIIKNLLEFSRESSVEAEPVDVNALLTRTLQLMHKYLQTHGVHVVTDLSPVPPCMANGNAMRQIVLNLITNAVQAMPQGGELHLRTRRSGPDRIELEVQDTGVGIPPEHLRDIFMPFYTTKGPGQGTGLGLSVVHSIIERYRGDIRVASTVGAGTAFTIALPCPCHEEQPAAAAGS